MIEKARLDKARDVAGNHAPAAGSSMAYESPEAVLADDSLSAAQKRRFLQGWQEALGAHLAGDEISAADADGEADLLARIRTCLSAID